MKKTYCSPEFEYIKFKPKTTNYTPTDTETPIDDIIEYDDDDDDV